MKDNNSNISNSEKWSKEETKEMRPFGNFSNNNIGMNNNPDFAVLGKDNLVSSVLRLNNSNKSSLKTQKKAVSQMKKPDGIYMFDHSFVTFTFKDKCIDKG